MAVDRISSRRIAQNDPPQQLPPPPRKSVFDDATNELLNRIERSYDAGIIAVATARKATPRRSQGDGAISSSHLPRKTGTDAWTSNIDLRRSDSYLGQPLMLSTWTAPAPRYTKAMKDLSDAVARRAPAAALTIARDFHRDLQRAYGTAANLLELDVLFRRLELAFEHESFDEAVRALDQTRCTLPDAETGLRDSAGKH